MRHQVLWFIISFLFVSHSNIAQELNDSCGFIDPVLHDIRSSGSFGEPRSSHFHSGIDIKPYKGAGKDEILAIGDGHVSRIKLSPDGYGRAVYVDHPCGFTSVYAHLDKLNPILSEYIHQVRMATRKSEVDQYPPPGALKVSKGDVLGYMGNSGFSFGAHLHFEIRKTNSETPIDPVLFGISPKDNIRPIINGIIIYSLDGKRSVLSEEYHQAKTLQSGKYFVQGNPILTNWPLIGIGIHTFDQSNGASNHNGIYAVKMRVDGRDYFSFRLDSIPFDKSKFLHAHMDYSRKKNNQYIHKCFTEDLNTLNIYKSDINGGLIIPNALIPGVVEIEVFDAHNNSSTLHFQLKANDSIEPIYWSQKEGEIPIYPGKDNSFECQNVHISIPSKTVLHPTNIGCKKTPEGIELFAKNEVPLFNSMRISQKLLTPTDKLVWVTRNEKRELINLGAQVENDSIIWTKVNELGEYFLFSDTIAPNIDVISNTGSSKIKFVVKDNLKESGKSTRLRYEAFINQKWIPVDYDLKNNIMEISIPESEDRPCTIQIVVEDYSGNRRERRVTIK